MAMDDAGVRGYLPGKREAAVFVALALLGLATWALTTPSVAAPLLPRSVHPFLLGVPLGLPFYAALAFLAGLLFPRGFWLWGAALFVLSPFAYAALAWRMESRGTDVLGDGPGAAVAYAVTLVMMAVGSALLATVVSALGAGLRVLPRALGALGRRRRSGGGARS